MGARFELGILGYDYEIAVLARNGWRELKLRGIYLLRFIFVIIPVL